VVPIGELATIVGGSTPSTKEPRFWNGGVHHWVTPKDLSNLREPVLLDTERKITDLGLAEVGSGLLPVGTVLLSSRAPIGYLAIAEIPVAINQGFIAMIPRDGVSNLYLLSWARWAHEQIVSRANGSTFLEISKSAFRPIPVICPPFPIFGSFERMLRPLYSRVVVNLRESRTVRALRDTLLPKLISGDLRVQAAERIVERHA
jgi:type I restriction enzyme S subunit